MTARCCKPDPNTRIEVGNDAEGNPSIEITGLGTAGDPFVLNWAGINEIDTDDINLSLTWVTDHYELSASFAASSNLDSIGDVNAPGPTDGQVLGWDNALAKWTPRAPTTASAGSVNTDTTLTGDGSVGTPLGVAFAVDGGLEDDSGVGLTDAVLNSTIRRYADDSARAADPLTPELNTLSMLDDNPGVVDYWDGADWIPLVQFTGAVGDEYLASSGSYAGTPVSLYVAQIADTTDPDGLFVALDATLLGTVAGALSVHVQPFIDTGDTAWFPVLDVSDLTQVVVIAYAADGSGPLPSTPVTATVTAYLY